MAGALATSQEFQEEFVAAVGLYKSTAVQLQDLCSLKLSDKLIAFFNRYSQLQNRNPEILRKIETVVDLFQEVEVEAQEYVLMARDLAEENKSLAQDVMAGARYLDPQSMLENFKTTAEDLRESFGGVAKKYSQIEKKIGNISDQSKSAGQQARRLAIEAEENVACNIPVLGLAVSPVVKAGKWADGANNPVLKGVAGVFGFVAGLLQGAVSTALVGIPAIVAAKGQERLENLAGMYENIVEVMKKFDELVKNHKTLVTEVSSRVRVLVTKYERFEKDLKRRKPIQPYQIKLFKDACDNIIQSCDKYMNRY